MTLENNYLELQDKLKEAEERTAAYESTLRVIVENRGGFLTGSACQDLARNVLEVWSK